MDEQYYYKLMASYLSKRTCDESLARCLLGKGARKSAEELERADERKRRLQRERSRRYRALKNARRSRAPAAGAERGSLPAADAPDDVPSDADEPPTLCDLTYEERWRECSDGASDDNSLGVPVAAGAAGGPGEPPARALAELLSARGAELDYPTVHSLMFHWLQT